MESFDIVPATSRALWVLFALLLVLFGGIAGVLGLSARGARASRFEISAEGLRVRGDLYGRLVPLGDVRGGAARIVDLTAERDLAPRLRTFGTALPSYSAGWFRLRNGEKALLYLTDRRHAVYVPTRLGYSLLLSPQRPERFVERLREVAPGA